MAETTYDRTKAPKRFTATVSRGLRESAVLAIGVIALVMLFALMSYHRDDPGFSTTGTATTRFTISLARSAPGCRTSCITSSVVRPTCSR
jgi:hypothetical protein